MIIKIITCMSCDHSNIRYYFSDSLDSIHYNSNSLKSDITSENHEFIQMHALHSLGILYKKLTHLSNTICIDYNTTLLKMGCSVACLKMTPQGCKLVAMETFDRFCV